LTDGLLAVTQHLRRPGTFDLRTLRGSHGNAAHGGTDATIQSAPSGSRVGALLRLLALVAAALLLFVAATKVLIRKGRYLTRDPRKLAAACVRELADYAADQGARAPESATLSELARLLEDELGVSARAFVASAARARFGPPAQARSAARAARGELRSLRRDLRAALTRTERALGLFSLRSLGLTP
jgi:hypothetical protein